MASLLFHKIPTFAQALNVQPYQRLIHVVGKIMYGEE